MKTSKNKFFDSAQELKIPDILEQKDNELLKRKEVKIIVEAAKNPSIDEASEIVIKEFKTDKELVAIKKVQGKFGRDTFLIYAFIYKNKEDKEEIEPKKKAKKGEKPAEQSAQPVKEQEKKTKEPTKKSQEKEDSKEQENKETK